MKIINELLVEDVRNSIQFYKDFFAFEICETTGNPITWARLQNGNTELMIEDYKTAIAEFVHFPAKGNSSNLLKFRYESIDEIKTIYEKIRNSNVEIFMELRQTDYGTTEFAVLDCDQNIIMISSK